ncbi:MAG: hypothetical protein NT161_00605 [Candidatus Nomurabacteria bacterium]|nr:hypothetical protein [Candidatus Nomurabacteria bacterium]
MDENTTKMIKERFNALPESIQELILSSNYQDILVEIGKKYQLNVEQLGMLEQETTLVMMGLTPTKDFETELTRELGIDKMKGNQIVTEINEKIFLTIRDLLKLMYTPEGEEPSIEETPEEPKKIENNLESREELLKKIENPNLLTEKELPAPAIPSTPSILSQKLSGAFQIPKTETEHSLENITKNNSTNDITTKNLPKIDPYREPTE